MLTYGSIPQRGITITFISASLLPPAMEGSLQRRIHNVHDASWARASGGNDGVDSVPITLYHRRCHPHLPKIPVLVLEKKTAHRTWLSRMASHLLHTVRFLTRILHLCYHFQVIMVAKNRHLESQSSQDPAHLSRMIYACTQHAMQDPVLSQCPAIRWDVKLLKRR